MKGGVASLRSRFLKEVIERLGGTVVYDSLHQDHFLYLLNDIDIND